MARSKSPTLTDAELRIMRVIWERGPSTVGDVVEALDDEEKVAYSTVQTFLRILEDKGYLKHRKEGRAYLYTAVVGAGQARKSALDYVLDRFFNNSPELLLLNVLDKGDIAPENAEAIRRLLSESEHTEDPS